MTEQTQSLLVYAVIIGGGLLALKMVNDLATTASNTVSAGAAAINTVVNAPADAVASTAGALGDAVSGSINTLETWFGIDPND